MPNFSFTIKNQDNLARASVLQTPRGEIQTPIFMPVGTQGSVKSLSPDDLEDAGAQIILGNTYHLMLRPGKEFLKAYGGLHKLMSWSKPILTDSGGFQVFSLSQGIIRGKEKSGAATSLVKIDENQVTFKSYLDGSIYPMPPEESMAIQMAIGSEIVMALDVCPMAKAPRDEIRKAMSLTTSWLKRCQDSMTSENARLFGIMQGGIHEDLRREHAQELAEFNLFGYAIGGLSVGEDKVEMWNTARASAGFLPKEKPRYLMGVGTPDDILEGIRCGIDMFDCVMPTRNARNGSLFTSRGKISIKNRKFQYAEESLDENCDCYTCQKFSKAYLRHLFISKELLYNRLASLHNITYYLQLTKDARNAILENRFEQFYREKKCAHQLSN